MIFTSRIAYLYLLALSLQLKFPDLVTVEVHFMTEVVKHIESNGKSGGSFGG